MTTTDPVTSAGGNAEQWLHTTPPPATHRNRNVWLLLALVAVIVVTVLVMAATGAAEQENGDGVVSYCQSLGLKDPGCAYMYR